MYLAEHVIELGKACEELRKVLEYVPVGELREHAAEILGKGLDDYSRALIEFAEDAIRDDMKKGLF
ncbi:hypothetical protein [Dialister hominis]|uniref:hypothetical protein n=1 Tax=Dialister hominis TaxID=2582419 RepID=UPI003FEF633E